MKRIISRQGIISAIAYWAVFQSPYDHPIGLEKALLAVANKIDQMEAFKSNKKGTLECFEEFTHEELVALLSDLIFHVPEINIWSIAKSEQDKGITDPHDDRREITFSGFTRFGPLQSPDNSFVDLNAMHQNVLEMLWNNH